MRKLLHHLNPFFIRRLLMTLKSETDQILAVVNAQTQTLAALATAVAAIPSAPGSTPPDLSGIQASLDKLNVATADIQAQLEDAPATPTPPTA